MKLFLSRFSLPPKNPAPDLFRQLPRNQHREIISLVSQTLVPDPTAAEAYAQHLAKIKSNTRQNTAEICSWNLQRILKTLADIGERVVLKALANTPGEAPINLGISSGLDCRFIYAIARKHGLPLSTFTFGAHGYSDFEWPCSAGIVDLQSHRLFDVNTHDWSLDQFDHWTSQIHDIPVSPRIPAILEHGLRHSNNGPIYEATGYFNGPRMTLQPRKEPKGEKDWEAAIGFLIKYNNDFDFQQFFKKDTLRKLYPKKPFMPCEALAYDHQSFLSYRENQRIRPRNFGPVQYINPFLDEDWIGFWLNAPSRFFGEHSIYNQMLAQYFPETFPDIVELFKTDITPVRKNRIAYYKSRLSPQSSHGYTLPHRPGNHFCFHACYKNNPSFKTFVDESLQRLRGRRLFHDSVIDGIFQRFINAEFSAAKQIKGLVTTDVALESGRLN